MVESDLFVLLPGLLQLFQVEAWNLRSLVATRERRLLLVLVLLSPFIVGPLYHFSVKRQVRLLGPCLLSAGSLLWRSSFL